MCALAFPAGATVLFILGRSGAEAARGECVVTGAGRRRGSSPLSFFGLGDRAVAELFANRRRSRQLGGGPAFGWLALWILEFVRARERSLYLLGKRPALALLSPFLVRAREAPWPAVSIRSLGRLGAMKVRCSLGNGSGRMANMARISRSASDLDARVAPSHSDPRGRPLEW